MISVIITAYKEPITIAKTIKSIVRPFYSGIPEDFELIQVSPDEETLNSANEVIKEEKWVKNFIQIKDPGKGKPTALNLALEKATGEIIILTDGDVYFEEHAIGHLLSEFHNPEVGGATGRPIASNRKDTFMGYIGNLLADAAHHKRSVNLSHNLAGKSSMFISKSDFFPLSGYIMAIRNYKLQLPTDVLADDAYISYTIFNMGKKLVYTPNARAVIKYPNNIKDYLLQKKRSLGGYIQLWKYGIVKIENKSRSFWHELQYFWFPIKYARNIIELVWSLLLYPLRLLTWVLIWWERKIIKKDFSSTWVRVESTK